MVRRRLTWAPGLRSRVLDLVLPGRDQRNNAGDNLSSLQSPSCTNPWLASGCGPGFWMTSSWRIRRISVFVSRGLSAWEMFKAGEASIVRVFSGLCAFNSLKRFALRLQEPTPQDRGSEFN